MSSHRHATAERLFTAMLGFAKAVIAKASSIRTLDSVGLQIAEHSCTETQAFVILTIAEVLRGRMLAFAAPIFVERLSTRT